MQKCDIDWPICSHEPVRARRGDNSRVDHVSLSTARKVFLIELCALTGICDVEEERHRHYCEQKRGVGCEHGLLSGLRWRAHHR